MNKAELEAHCDRLSKEKDFYKSIIYDLKQMLVPAAETFSNGLAEETDFNFGVQHALDVVATIINSKICESSYLHCPSFKNVVEEQQRPRFTIIEGGLCKRNNGDNHTS